MQMYYKIGANVLPVRANVDLPNLLMPKVLLPSFGKPSFSLSYFEFPGCMYVSFTASLFHSALKTAGASSNDKIFHKEKQIGFMLFLVNL